MGSSLPIAPPSLPIASPFLLGNGLRAAPANPFFYCRPHRTSRRRGSSSTIKPRACWVDSDGRQKDPFGGWFLQEREIRNKNGFSKLLMFVGIGSSAAAILFATLAYCCWWKKGSKSYFAAPFAAVYEKLKQVESEEHEKEDPGATVLEVHQILEKQLVEKADTTSDESKENQLAGVRKVVVAVATDPIQEEAISALKKLKIIEDNVNGNELCTKREYARWLVKGNYILERNPQHRIVPEMLHIGSAFDDVYLDDPDFWWIQSLAEVGIVHSKLSEDGSSGDQEKFYFYPESSLSRFDLVNWKTLLDYPFCSLLDVKISMSKTSFLDVSAPPDALPQLYKDLMANDKSIIRRAFGNIRRLQPQKPVTKAQAAVVLASGRMEEFIHSELSRLEAENSCKLAEIEEIRAELIRRGDIQRLWEEKLENVKHREHEVEKDLKAALLDLESEKAVQDESLLDYIKEKAALDCQQQLLQNLREEVNEMYDKLESERDNFVAEKQNIEKLSADLCSKQDAIVEAKSILEAEKEATRIVRYWVNEEALQMQFRAKGLEQAIRRWQYHEELGVTLEFSAGSNSSKLVQEPKGKQL